MSAIGDLLEAIRNDASHTVREVIARKKVDLSGDLEPFGTPLFFAASLGRINCVNVTWHCSLLTLVDDWLIGTIWLMADRHFSNQAIATFA